MRVSRTADSRASALGILLLLYYIVFIYYYKDALPSPLWRNSLRLGSPSDCRPIYYCRPRKAAAPFRHPARQSSFPPTPSSTHARAVVLYVPYRGPCARACTVVDLSLSLFRRRANVNNNNTRLELAICSYYIYIYIYIYTVSTLVPSVERQSRCLTSFSTSLHSPSPSPYDPSPYYNFLGRSSRIPVLPPLLW